MKKKFLEPTLFWGTIVLFIVLLVSHNYNDLLATTRHGINFWTILLDGNFFAFYDINICASGNTIYNMVQGCAYNILVYIVFAVWNFPLYLMERLGGIDVMNNIFCLIYAKLLPVAAMAITIGIVKNILVAMDIPKKQHSLLLYLYASSALIVSVIFITGQYDILSLVFQLLGVYAFIRGKDKQFIIWFGVAFCFKFFAFVIFLPLLLLRYKKLLSWIKSICAFLSFWIITKIPFWVYAFFAESTTTVQSGGELAAVNFLGSMLGSANINICLNLFVVSYIAILVWCYLQKNDSTDNVYNGIWVCLLSYTAFFGLMNAYPYWSVLLAPFVTLVIAMAPANLYLNLILETIGMAALVLTNMVRYSWVYFGDTLKPMIWSHILEGTNFSVGYEGSRIASIIVYLSQETYHQEQAVPAILNSAFVAAIISLAAVAYPGTRSNRLYYWPERPDYQDMVLVRFAANSILCLLPILAVFL